ncbi:MAG TPA: ADP-ribosylglycohydrolase family protein [Candidatus Paceibacterota bacterium]
MPTTKQDRYRGVLVGVLAGDALGAPYETWDAKKVEEDFTRRGGLTTFEYPDPWEQDGTFPKGRPTDDSDHTAALAQSLVAQNGLNEEDLFYRLRTVVFDHKSPLWEGKAVGAGKTTRNALRPLTWEESSALSTDGAFPSNGSLMRSAPLALFLGAHISEQSEIIRRASSVTHRHPIAGDCCVAYVTILGALLEGKELTEGIEKAKTLVHEKEVLGILRNFETQPRDPEVWPGRGAAVLTLHVALWAFVNARDFREGIAKTVAFGGDTDTYGAVAGGLLGAYFGIEGIPSEWREVLLGREIMESLADSLYEISSR